jgi:cytochrome c-type biogenesis protein CcmH/NrfG
VRPRAREPCAPSKLYELDLVAVAIVHIEGTADESLIKRLLLKRPESAQLHFALDNAYSASTNWPKAQSAYFDAHRNDSQNPDYASNLAVSLVRM